MSTTVILKLFSILVNLIDSFMDFDDFRWYRKIVVFVMSSRSGEQILKISPGGSPGTTETHRLTGSATLGSLAGDNYQRNLKKQIGELYHVRDVLRQWVGGLVYNCIGQRPTYALSSPFQAAARITFVVVVTIGSTLIWCKKTPSHTPHPPQQAWTSMNN